LADRRADKYFGRYIKQRIEGSQSVINRRIPVPGLIATRHGPTGGWTFAVGNGRGTRFVTDQTGAFVQDVYYRPFGVVSFAAGAVPGSANYTSEQWNGGDLLSTLGVVNLGARVYDPVVGRFLSRDPILQAESPYAFASNDPINSSDPTGMFQECIFCGSGNGSTDKPGNISVPGQGGVNEIAPGSVVPNSMPDMINQNIAPVQPCSLCSADPRTWTDGPTTQPDSSDLTVDFGAPWPGGPSSPGGVLAGLFASPESAIPNYTLNNPSGDRCNKSCHPGSNGLLPYNPQARIYDGRAIAGGVLLIAAVAVTAGQALVLMSEGTPVFTAGTTSVVVTPTGGGDRRRRKGCRGSCTIHKSRCWSG
jgi:RHS repeat-associated protein